jgi:GH15 family glucan-1,4-alpha-glucosidase
MVRRACGFLIREGPITVQDRWEEARGYSPSTLAVHVAALICGAEFFDDRGEHATAEFIRDYADFLESHIERWTVTTEGAVVDAVLKVETPYGPSWRRYNHDGYGQREDGTSYVGWGTGWPWPLLTGERGHYEIAAGRDPSPYLHALEDFSQGIGLMPEQIWDGPDLPPYLRLGRSTDAPMPLLWAHSEYVKLHRSRPTAKSSI